MLAVPFESEHSSVWLTGQWLPSWLDLWIDIPGRHLILGQCEERSLRIVPEVVRKLAAVASQVGRENNVFHL